MKSISVISILSLFTLAAYADYNVSESINVSEATGFGGTVTFTGSNKVLTIDTSASANAFSLATSTSNTVTINGGQTLTLAGDSSNYDVKATNNTAVLTFDGAGTLLSSSTSERFVTGTVNFKNSVVQFNSSLSCVTTGSVINIYSASLTAKGSSLGTAVSFNVKSGANVSLGTGSYASWGVGNTTTVESGATMSVGSVRAVSTATNNYSNNTITIGGTMSITSSLVDSYSPSTITANKTYTAWFNKLYVSSTGSLNITGTYGTLIGCADASGNLNGTLDVSGNVTLAGKLYIQNGATLNVRSSNTIKTEGAASQDLSNIYFATVERPATSGRIGRPCVDFGDLLQATASLNLYADNDFGTFTLYNSATSGGGSLVNVTLNGNLMSLVGLAYVNDISTNPDCIVNFTDFAENTVKVKFGDVETLSHFTSDGEALYFGTSAGDGYTWLTATVPEPAEWAAIFGALALGLAIYRKRAKRA